MRKFIKISVLTILSQFFYSQNTLTPTGNSTEIGNLNGELSVTLTGASNYTIPISTLPGIKDMVPKIGLVYNSQASNSIAGFG